MASSQCVEEKPDSAHVSSSVFASRACLALSCRTSAKAGAVRIPDTELNEKRSSLHENLL